MAIDPYDAAIQMLRDWPSDMNETERFSKLCVALACDFPELTDQVISIATNAMTRWKRSH